MSCLGYYLDELNRYAFRYVIRKEGSLLKHHCTLLYMMHQCSSPKFIPIAELGKGRRLQWSHMLNHPQPLAFLRIGYLLANDFMRHVACLREIGESDDMWLAGLELPAG